MKNWTPAYKESLNGGILLILGLAIYGYASGFPDLEEGYPGPALFPQFIALGFAISGIFLLGKYLPKALKEKTPSSDKDKSEEQRLLSLLGGIAVVAIFPLVFDSIGFLIPLAITVFLIALMLRISYVKSALLGVGATGAVYLIFNVLLNVPL
ncbi:MAG: tripartite tricarboxylate transporter TctB family protein [Bacteroidia bacterium]|nr:tripartite tricarboxylate transporter TctB family protein [Bacteroidia bacterium]